MSIDKILIIIVLILASVTIASKYEKLGVDKKKINVYNETIKEEGSDFYENKNNRKGTKDNRSNQ